MVNMQTCFGALVFGVLAITPVSAQQFCAGYGCGDRYGYDRRDGSLRVPYVEPYRPYYTPGRERRMDRRDYRYDRRYDRREDRYERY